MVQRLKVFFLFFLFLFINLTNVNFISASSPNLIDGTQGLPSLDTATTSNNTYNVNYTYNVTNITNYIGGITWDMAMNGTLLSYVDALNKTLFQTAWWNATNTSYYLASNPSGYISSFTEVDPYWKANWTNFTTLYSNQVGNSSTRDYALNNSLWTLNYSNMSIGWLYAVNSTGGTEDLWNANYSTFLTHMPYSAWNSTNTSYLTYANWNATNTTYDTWLKNYTGYNASWNNMTNTSYYLATNPFNFYNSTNPPPASAETYWNGNFSNFSQLWNNQYTNYTNFTTMYGNQLGNASNFTTIYGWNVGNTTALLGGSNWNANYTNFSTLYGNQYGNASNMTTLYSNQVTNSSVYAYATNGSGWVANYSTYLLKPTYAQVTNGTIIMRYQDWNATNTSYLTYANWNSTNTSYYVDNTHGYFNSTNPDVLTNASAIYYANTTINNSMKSYVDSKLITTFFNHSAVSVVRGTPEGTNESINVYDNIVYNITEEAGAVGMDFIVNFSGIAEFNQIIFRTKDENAGSITTTVYLWDYTEGIWESYAVLSTLTDYTVKEIGVYDEDDHISGGVVQLRFYQPANGNINRKHMFDWVTLAQGPATPSGAEVDPYSLHTTDWLTNYSTLMLYSNWNSTNTSYYLETNPFGFYNVTTAPIYSNDTFVGNYSNFTTLYANSFSYYNSTNFPQNASLMTYANWNSTNESYYLKTNPFGFYNVTTAPIYVNDTFLGNYSNFTALYSNQVTNSSTLGYAINSSLWTLNYSDYLSTKNYALNDSLWTLNYSTYLLKPTYAQVVNGTIVMRYQDWNSTNTSYYLETNPFGFYNVTTAPIYVNDTFSANYTNFTSIYSGLLGNASNLTSIYGNIVGNASTRNYALNATPWTLNFTNFSTMYSNIVTNASVYPSLAGNASTRGYALNSSLWTLNFTNFTTLYSNQVTNSTVYPSLVSNASTRSYALNSSLWTLNFTNFTTIYGWGVGNSTVYPNLVSNASTRSYALNSSLWTLNYTTFLTHMPYSAWNSTNTSYLTYANWNATNTSYFDLGKANTVGAFNQTFDTNTLFVDATDDRIGIGTLSPFAKFEVNASDTTQILWLQNLRNNGNADVTGYGSGIKFKLSNDDGNEINKWAGITSVAQSGWANTVGLAFYVQPNIESAPVEKMRIDESGRLGILTTTPQNALNVLGDTNATGTVYAQITKNLSIGYDYALNNTLGNNASLMTYANWNATNTSYYLTTNPFGFYNVTTAPIYVNDTFFGNWTNFTTIYGNALGWANNASNFSSVYGNSLTWIANYSTYLLKPTWANIVNGTVLINNTDVYLKTTKYTETAGNCDLTILHSTCANSTGTYQVG